MTFDEHIFTHFRKQIKFAFYSLLVVASFIYSFVTYQHSSTFFFFYFFKSPHITIEDLCNPAMWACRPFFCAHLFKNVILFVYEYPAIISIKANKYLTLAGVVNTFLKSDLNSYNTFLKNFSDFNTWYSVWLYIRYCFLYSWYFFKNYTMIIFDGPWFLKFGSLFILSTVMSLFCLSYLGLYGVFILNVVPLFLFWTSSMFFIKDIFFEKNFFFINFGKWFSFNINQKINFELYIDYISLSFIILTLTIAFFVYLYCFSYFRFEPNVERLMLFINLFVISMILLVSSGNFVVLFLGWELIGLTSFFLINFWSTRMGTLKAAFKAFVFNKFSDVSILIGCILVYLLIQDFNILTFNNEIHNYVNYYISFGGINFSYIELISFFLVSAAFIKSAQFGTHIWLPDSMEAPVPASALIHSATLVSAGIFLLLRFTPLFELSTYVYVIIPVVGSFTAFFGGIGAAYQSDIKRILAYSTISHCGFLMVTFSTHVAEYTLLYLYIHGFFKAAVFLCVGNVIRFSRNYQDFRRMGSFYKYLPLECFSSFICLLNLSGLPFTLGFYIKHVILIGMPDFFNKFIFLNIIGGALCGIIYSFRLFYYVFFDFKKAKKSIFYASTRNSLKSYFYSNTTLASSLAIIGLIFFSYVISFFLLGVCVNDIVNNSDITHFSWINSSINEFNNPTLSLLKNISYVNWFIIFIALLSYLVKWRYFYNYNYVYNKYYFYLNSAIVFTLIINFIYN